MATDLMPDTLCMTNQQASSQIVGFQETLRRTPPAQEEQRNLGPYLQGQGDFVSRFILGIMRATMWAVGIFNLLLRPPDLQVDRV